MFIDGIIKIPMKLFILEKAKIIDIKKPNKVEMIILKTLFRNRKIMLLQRF